MFLVSNNSNIPLIAELAPASLCWWPFLSCLFRCLCVYWGSQIFEREGADGPGDRWAGREMVTAVNSSSIMCKVTVVCVLLLNLIKTTSISEGQNTHGWYLGAQTFHWSGMFAVQGQRAFCGAPGSVCVSFVEDAHPHRTAHVHLCWRAPLTRQHCSAASDGN